MDRGTAKSRGEIEVPGGKGGERHAREREWRDDWNDGGGKVGSWKSPLPIGEGKEGPDCLEF